MSRVNEIPFFTVLFRNGVVLIIINEQEFKRFIRQNSATRRQRTKREWNKYLQIRGVKAIPKGEMSLNIFSEKFVDIENIKLPKPGVAF